MRALACDLDHLERHIDWYGSVVAKIPDVWGQARLTQYREEFEQQMSPENNPFYVVLNGSLARSDQAFFASATALSFAAQPKPPVVGRVTSTKAAEPPKLIDVEQQSTIIDFDRRLQRLEVEQTLRQLPPPAPPAPAAPKVDPIKPIELGDPAALLADPNNAIKRELLAGRTIGFEKLKASGISLEPTEVLAQKKRYLDLLNQLRRENEGDDTADSPGYSLNLMRIPVSILPGKRTDVGFGSEITLTLTPILGDDLLPTTFRHFVINDLVQQLGFPLAIFLDEDRRRKKEDKYLREDVQEYLWEMEIANRLSGQTTPHTIQGISHTTSNADAPQAMPKFAATSSTAKLATLVQRNDVGMILGQLGRIAVAEFVERRVDLIRFDADDLSFVGCDDVAILC